MTVAAQRIRALVAECDDAAECARLAAELSARAAALLSGGARATSAPTSARGGSRTSSPAPGDVVSVSKAASALPMRDGDARAWLRRRGLVCKLDGRSAVVWDDVLAALREPQKVNAAPATPRRRPRTSSLAGITPLDL